MDGEETLQEKLQGALHFPLQGASQMMWPPLADSQWQRHLGESQVPPHTC